MRLVKLVFLATVVWGLLPALAARGQDQDWDGWELMQDPSFMRNPDRQVLRNFRVPEDAEAERLIGKAREAIANEHFAAAVEHLHEVITILQAATRRGNGSHCACLMSASAFLIHSSRGGLVLRSIRSVRTMRVWCNASSSGTLDPNRLTISFTLS